MIAQIEQGKYFVSLKYYKLAIEFFFDLTIFNIALNLMYKSNLYLQLHITAWHLKRILLFEKNLCYEKITRRKSE